MVLELVIVMVVVIICYLSCFVLPPCIAHDAGNCTTLLQFFILVIKLNVNNYNTSEDDTGVKSHFQHCFGHRLRQLEALWLIRKHL